MTKNESDYAKMLKQMDDLQRKLSEKKELLDKERDEQIIKAIHEIDITREQGYALAKILLNEENLDIILGLKPKEEFIQPKKGRPRRTDKEREVKKDEE